MSENKSPTPPAKAPAPHKATVSILANESKGGSPPTKVNVQMPPVKTSKGKG